MILDEDRKIIEQEIDRLERRYRDAQESYAYSGSASTDRTMHKYDTIKNALENYLYRREDDAHERTILIMTDQLRQIRDAIGDAYRGGKIDGETYVKLTDILRR